MQSGVEALVVKTFIKNVLHIGVEPKARGTSGADTGMWLHELFLRYC